MNGGARQRFASTCLALLLTSLSLQVPASETDLLARATAAAPAGMARVVVYIDAGEDKPNLAWSSLRVLINSIERARITAANPVAVVDVPAGRHLLGINHGSRTGTRRPLELAPDQQVFLRFARSTESEGGYEPTTRDAMRLEERDAEAALADLRLLQEREASRKRGRSR